MVEGYSVRQLCDMSRYTPRTMRRVLGRYLDQQPEPADDLSPFQYLVMDGSYLEGRQQAVIGLADPTQNRIVAGIYGIKEGEARMYDFCSQLAQRGLSPRSVTIDGLPQVHTMVTKLWPQAVVQRCLVHIQRQGLAWCRHQPKRPDTQHLRQFFTRVMAIHTPIQRDDFIDQWQRWEERWGPAIVTSTETGWTFGDLKRARSLLTKALPYMFAYLEDPAIPKSTNWLEGYFSRLKSRYRQHRGLPPYKRHNYFAWYFHLCHT
jgi:transposase-like protein